MTAAAVQPSRKEVQLLARWAGGMYVVLGLATLVGFYHGPLVHGEFDDLAHAIMASESRFRLGVLSDILAAVLTVPLALILHQLFRPVQATLAALMALWLLVPLPISFIGALDDVAARHLYLGAQEVAGLTSAQREAIGQLLLRLHVHTVLAEEVFWGLWLIPFGLLVPRSCFMPPLLGGLLIVAGIAYVGHSVASMPLGEPRVLPFERITMLLRAAGELPVMLWLLFKGASPHAQVS